MVTTWRDVAKGDRVEVGGRVFTIEKVKAKGKRVKVTVRGGGTTLTSEVKASDEVKVAAEPLRDRKGAQRRWASETERAEAERPFMGAGEIGRTEAPREPEGKKWTKPRDEIERELMDDGAVLVAETDDESAGWYVPPVDISTVYAHMRVFHGTRIFKSEPDALAEHDEEHRRAERGDWDLPITHFHVKRRP